MIRNTFARFALPMVWDYVEVNPLSNSSGSYLGALDWVVRVVAHTLKAAKSVETPVVQNSSVTEVTGEYDVIVTDPPYYDAIPYSDLMDFFHVWLRRSTHGISAEIDAAFGEPLGPKWNHDSGDGELVDQYNRFAFDASASKAAYEEGMLCAFQACHQALRDDGRLVVAFANKQPQAWETLVSALIRSGFVVGNSWPIQTEMQNQSGQRRPAGLVNLAGVQETATSSSRMGQHRAGRDAREHHSWPARFLGCRHPRARLRLGGDRPCAGGIQQVSGGQKS